MFHVNLKYVYILFLVFLGVTDYLLTAAACAYFPVIKLMKPVRGTYTSESHLSSEGFIFLCNLLWVSPWQPVHNNGSSGYGSLGSNGSHEHYISVASSSDSNGNLWEDSHREPVRWHSWITLSQADCIADGEINRYIVRVHCLCVIADEPTADLCWCEQSEELGPASLPGVKSQNPLPGKTCKR